MISPDSNLYKEHPEWAIQIPGRETTESRCQYVLDLSRPEVQDYAYESVAKILRSANIKYVKWDMNRQLSDLGSTYLDEDSQQELFHRYVLGMYAMQERLVQEFPDLLLENCSGGSARFDQGMLYYSRRSGAPMTPMRSSVWKSGGNRPHLPALRNGCTRQRMPEPHRRPCDSIHNERPWHWLEHLAMSSISQSCRRRKLFLSRPRCITNIMN